MFIIKNSIYFNVENNPNDDCKLSTHFLLFWVTNDINLFRVQPHLIRFNIDNDICFNFRNNQKSAITVEKQSALSHLLYNIYTRMNCTFTYEGAKTCCYRNGANFGKWILSPNSPISFMSCEALSFKISTHG